MNKKCLSAWPIALIFIVALTVTSTAQAGCYDKRKPGMDWSGCKKTNKMLNDQNFTGSRFDNANLMMSNLDNSNFTNASMVKT
ncbi:MAG: pentapeptide repeat-containing protein, partial [Gammaproteobacteria bacterium]|nr:pentapeptide repeat-containing protein [Gammaproteobacteria bacterium]